MSQNSCKCKEKPSKMKCILGERPFTVQDTACKTKGFMVAFLATFRPVTSYLVYATLIRFLNFSIQIACMYRSMNVFSKLTVGQIISGKKCRRDVTDIFRTDYRGMRSFYTINFKNYLKINTFSSRVRTFCIIVFSRYDTTGAVFVVVTDTTESSFVPSDELEVRNNAVLIALKSQLLANKAQICR